LKQLPPEKRQEVPQKWQEYQQLPPEKRKELSSRNGAPPAAQQPPPEKRREPDRRNSPAAGKP
jgi:hypothetical protein